jgi:Ser/Thr protein kinase RdoA (MazF antagonist)
MSSALTLRMTRFVRRARSARDAVLHYDVNEDNLVVWYWCVD